MLITIEIYKLANFENLTYKMKYTRIVLESLIRTTWVTINFEMLQERGEVEKNL